MRSVIHMSSRAIHHARSQRHLLVVDQHGRVLVKRRDQAAVPRLVLAPREEHRPVHLARLHLLALEREGAALVALHGGAVDNHGQNAEVRARFARLRDGAEVLCGGVVDAVQHRVVVEGHARVRRLDAGAPVGAPAAGAPDHHVPAVPAARLRLGGRGRGLGARSGAAGGSRRCGRKVVWCPAEHVFLEANKMSRTLHFFGHEFFCQLNKIHFLCIKMFLS
jgi:hypothetical protein